MTDLPPSVRPTNITVWGGMAVAEVAWLLRPMFRSALLVKIATSPSDNWAAQWSASPTVRTGSRLATWIVPSPSQATQSQWLLHSTWSTWGRPCNPPNLKLKPDPFFSSYKQKTTIRSLNYPDILLLSDLSRSFIIYYLCGLWTTNTVLQNYDHLCVL